MMAYCAIAYGGMSLYYMRKNKKRLAGLEDHVTEGLSEEEIQELGDDS
jgi:hypothetical protein